MKFTVALAAALAANADAAAVFQKRQGGNPDVSDCGLEAFEGHTSEALLFCSSILRSGTATRTVTKSGSTTVTTTRSVTTTVRPPPAPTPTPKPSATPTPKPSASSGPSSSAKPSSPVPAPSSTVVTLPSPSPTAAPSCGIVAYVKSIPAYYFESSGTKNTFLACQALCKADAKCLSFGYGEANCMLFDVPSADNTNYNPMSPYTFYDVACLKEVPVRKRQLNVNLPLPGGINISLGLNGPREISSACSCLITKGPASTTVTTTTSAVKTATVTVIATVTRSVVVE
ncbi:hypothetical protein BDU57DRAFT_331576 [Ampelomyces quisqualis]|uniref:Apple domain-containing protein n=1 Tax=Ampelomyces quisqualis TaxID=50730 RepID=A0A6A5QF11_AMPQU|nr:hypothetical protein BDU57DRAFT_331576 [Ampelomyces quisqualis]